MRSNGICYPSSSSACGSQSASREIKRDRVRRRARGGDREREWRVDWRIFSATHRQAVDCSDFLTDRVDVQERLSRVFADTVSCVNDRPAAEFRRSRHGPRFGMAQNDYVTAGRINDVNLLMHIRLKFRNLTKTI